MKATNVFHGPAKNAKTQGPDGNTTATTPVNWSAYAVTDKTGHSPLTRAMFMPNGTFPRRASTIATMGLTCLPSGLDSTARLFPATCCRPVPKLTAVLRRTQLGTDGYTAGRTGNSASEPCYSYSFNLPVNPGDLVVAEVWYTTAASHGHATIYNYTTQQSASVSFNQPPSASAHYVGNSVEWVVERPNGGAPNLTN